MKVRASVNVKAAAILLAVAVASIFFGYLAFLTLKIGLEMSDISQESRYYQSLDDWYERDTGAKLVSEKRAVYLNSSDSLTRIFAKFPPLCKILVVTMLGGAFLFSAILLVGGIWENLLSLRKYLRRLRR